MAEVADTRDSTGQTGEDQDRAKHETNRGRSLGLSHPHIDPDAGQRVVSRGIRHGTMKATTFDGVVLTFG